MDNNNYEKEQKSFKVKEIKKIENKNKKINIRLALEAGACALSLGTLLWMTSDNTFNVNEDSFFSITNFLKFSISFFGVKFFGQLVKDIIEKCKIQGVKQYLEKDEEFLVQDENFEEKMKRS